jgi:alanine dehydrogenase
MPVLFLNNDDVQNVLTMKDCVRVLEEGQLEAGRGELAARPRIDTISPTRTPERFYRWGTMEGTSKALQTHAIRMKSDVVYWPRAEGRIVEEKYAGRPGLFCGLLFLFDTSNGEPLALMQEGYLQHLRVGGRNAIGVKYLAKKDASAVGMLGSGGMARSHLMAFCAVRPIERVKVYSPTRAHREAYADEMAEALGVNVEPVDNPREAVAGADIVSTCTNSMDHILFGDMLEPGMHVTSVGQELADDVPPRIDVTLGGDGRARTFRGQPIPSIPDGGGAAVVYAAANDEELRQVEKAAGMRYMQKAHPPAQLKARSVSLADLVAGAPGRLTDAEISASSGIRGSAGGGGQGIAFVTVGRLVYDLAREKGLGMQLPTELFLQDIRD